MPPRLDPGSERVEACLRAAQQLVSEFGGSQNAAAKEKGISQQTLSKLLSKRQVGIDFADQLAALYGTTVDGLVWLFLKGGTGAVKACNVVGWEQAEREARERWGEELPWELARGTVLAQAPKVITAEMVYDLTLLYHKHVRPSHTRLRSVRARS